MLLVVAGAMLLGTGCKSLFPSQGSTIESRWNSYAAAQAAFDKIIPDRTGTNELKQLGFHPAVSPNVRILTYVDIMQMFMPNPGINERDLPKPVRECIENPDNCYAYLVDLRNVHSKRYGNLFLDILGFKRKTHEDGWRFKGLILIRNGLVVYKLSSGEPRISQNQKQIQPLGPLQQLDGVMFHVVTIPK